jgi:tripartite-type tricarboxylate transporter receptor subunit TctC
MIFQRLKLCFAVMAFCSTMLGPATAYANDYPTRPVKIVYGYPAGGAGDVIGRLVAERLSALLGQQFIMENRSGASGTIAASAVSRADPDGYTILLVIESHAINPSLFAMLPYDTGKDFAPIGMVGRAPLMLVVNEKVPAKSIQDFVNLSKQSENGLTIAHFGPGSPQFAAMLGLSQKADIKFSDVPYRGGAPAISDLVAGHIQSFFMTQGSALAYTNAGQLRALAVASADPLPLYPVTPTLRSAGYDVVAEHWFGFVVPARTPAAILTKLEDALAEALAQPAMQTRLTELGIVMTPMRAAAFREFLIDQTRIWDQFNRKNNLVGSVK